LDSLGFNFEANVAPLTDAIGDAIRLLDLYEDKMNQVATAGKLTAGVSEWEKYSASISGVLDSLAKVESMLNSLDPKETIDLTEANSHAESATKELAAAFVYLNQVLEVADPELALLNATLATVINKMDTSAASVLNSKNAYVKLDSEVKKTSTDLKNTKDKTKEVGDEQQKATKKADNYTKSLNRLHGSLFSLKTLIAGMIGMGLGQMFTESIRQSMNYIENLNMFNVAMGDSINKANEFMYKMQEIYGMDPSNLMRYAGEFYLLADAIGMPTKAASTMSLSLTKMSNDLASLWNMPIEKVQENLSSGLQGMTRAVRKYGMDIRVVTMQQEAYRLGLDMNTKTTSEANRMGLRYILMVRQAYKAQGDFARTIESPANQLRILKEQFLQLGRAIGNFFLGALSSVLPYINGVVMALRSMLTVLNSFLGFTLPTFDYSNMADYGDSISGIGDAASDAAKKVKQLTSPLDELNVLAEESAGAGAGAGAGLDDMAMDPKIQAELEALELQLENIEMKANKVRDAIMKALGFEKVIINGEVTWEFHKDLFLQNLKDLGDKIIGLLPPAIQEALAKGFQGSSSLFSNINSLVTNVISTIREAFTNADWQASMAENWGGVFKGILDGWATFSSTVIGVVSDVIAELDSSWKEHGAGLVGGLLEAVSNVGGVLLSLGKNLIEPIFNSIMENLKFIWDNGLKDLVGTAADTFGSIGELIFALWNNVLMPLLDYLIGVWGPIISMVFQNVLDVAGTLLAGIAGVINGLMEVLNGIITFLVGVFTGNWKKMWEGIQLIFTGIWDAIKAVLKTALNLMIDMVNSFIRFIWSGLQSIINAINSVIEKANELLGTDFGGFDIGPAPKIPRLAQGAVVTGPTVAQIGEGSYDEAVIPLGESPQMKQLVRDIADAVGGSGGDLSANIVVELDGEVVYRNQQKIKRDRGLDFGMGVFAR
jgi:hypothetical protein